MENKIYYGFGKDYLKDWNMQSAFREIFQNFLDYGEYEQVVLNVGDIAECTLLNAWQPESLDFLRIGNSQKTNPNAIGKHGEGLKMAFLILLREGLKSRIMTPKHAVYPMFYVDKEIGECFCFEYEEHGISNVQYSVWFESPYDQLQAFLSNIIRDEDVIFDDNYYGRKVNKNKGNIYSGGLYVTTVQNMSAAYDIRPSHLPLDRDRSVPQSFDVNFTTSKINEAHSKLTAVDLSHNDTMFMTTIPESVKKQIKPIQVGNSVQFTYKNAEGKTEVLKHDHLANELKKDSFFARAIQRIKNMIAKQLGLYDMLLAFQKKHYLHGQAKEDFEMILEKCGKQEKIKQPKKPVLADDDLAF